MKWVHEFFQRNPDDSSGFYYFSQRESRAILESVQKIKNGYYKAIIVVPTQALAIQWQREVGTFNFQNVLHFCTIIEYQDKPLNNC